MENKKSRLIWIIGGATVILGGIIVAVILLLGGKEPETEIKQNDEPDVETVEQEDDTSVVSTDDESEAVRNLTTLSVVADNNTDYGIALNTAFILTDEEGVGLSVEDIRRHVTISPDVDFDVEALDSGAFLLKTKDVLVPDEIIKVAFQREGEDFGWAFQTIADFDVLRTLPTNNGWDVPKNSGIEMIFTKEVPEGIDPYFDISPATLGRFAYDGNKVTFIPDVDLRANTQYRITIGTGYGYEDDHMMADYTFSFHTTYQWQNEHPISFSASSQLFVSDTTQLLRFMIHNRDIIGADAAMTIYQLTDAKAFMDGITAMENLEDMDDIVNLVDYQTQSVMAGVVSAKDESYVYEGWINMNQTLDHGFYLVRIDIEGTNFYEFVQVGPYQAYVAQDSDELLIWAMDSIHDDVAENLSVYINNEFYGVTNDSGICRTIIEPLIETDVNFIVLVDDAGLQLVVDMTPVYNYYYGYDAYWYGYSSSQTYWTFCDTERSNYLPTDDIYFYGFIQERSGNHLDQVTIKLRSNLSVIEEMTVRLTDIGSFDGMFHIEDYLFGSLFIDVYDGDQLVGTKYVSVGDFELPAYMMDITFDQDVIMMGDDLQVDVTTSFYDGMPASGTDIELSADSYESYFEMGGVSSRVLTTDVNGNANMTITPYVDTDTWHPMYYSVSGVNMAYQDYYNYSRDSVILFPRDTMIETKTQIDEEKISVIGDVSSIDMSGYNGAIYNYNDFRGAPRSDWNIRIEIFENYYEKVFVGQVYDEINHVTYDEYEYNYIENLMVSMNVATDENGVFEMPYYLPVEGRNYQFVMTLYDSEGRLISAYENIGYNPEASAAYEGMVDDYYALYIETDKYSYRTGETVHVDLTYGGDILADTSDNQALYIICQDGFDRVIFASDLHAEFLFEAGYIPNIKIKGILYDGNNMIELNESYVDYDQTERVLTVEIDTEYERYSAGDTVKGSIHIENEAGNPIIADYHIAVVDEAYFAVFEEWDDLLFDLYVGVYNSGIINSGLASGLTIPDQFWGAEGGDGYEEGRIRTDFDITATFFSGTTDINGNDLYTFALPDNMTQWRMTAIAVSDDIEYGKSVERITATQDYYVHVNLPDIYLSEDDINISMNSAGIGIEGVTSYHIEIADVSEQMETILTDISGNGRDYVTANVGNLAPGTYELTVWGSNGDYHDAITQTFSVVDTYQQIKTAHTDTLDGYELPDTAHQVELIMTNSSATEHFMNIYNIYGYGYSSRLDLRLASDLAARYLNDVYGSELVLDGIENLHDYLSGNILSELTYSSGDPCLTAMVLSLDSEDYLDSAVKSTVSIGLEQYMVSDYVDVNEWFACVWGLSALDRPVLLDLQEAMSEEVLISPELNDAKLYALMAMVDMGDLETAKTYFRELMADYVTTDSSLTTGDRQWDAMMMLAATRLEQKTEAKGFYETLSLSRDIKQTTIPQRLVYLMSVEPTFTEASFTYILEGVENTVTLSDFDSYVIDLLPQQLDDIEFGDIEGDIDVHTTFIGTPEDMIVRPDILVERQYYVDGEPVNNRNVHQGDIVTVEIVIEVPDEVYGVIIEDVLPAGLVYYQNQYDNWYYGAYSQVRDKEIVTTAYKDFNSNQISVSYKTIATSAGTYTADYLVVQDIYGIGGVYLDQEIMVINP